jgi:predicted nucleotidyltransferase component of viral defense system
MDRTNPYFRQVELLVRVLPHVARQQCFALKGGTAINLFVRDLPRLSVDIDLTYLPLDPRDQALPAIQAALEKIAQDIQSLGGVRAQLTKPGETESLRLTVQRDSSQVVIELSPVLRGTVWPAETRGVVPAVEESFGYAEIPVVSFNDLFAGKICAALDRQHPRDLFDVRLLLANEGISRDLLRTFLIYLISHGRTMAELLAPKRRDIAPVFEAEFRTMARDPVSLEDLLQTREELIAKINRALTEDDRRFLLSVKGKTPDWSLIGFPQAAQLPAVRWKLENLGRMNAKKHEQALGRLEQVLAGGAQ